MVADHGQGHGQVSLFEGSGLLGLTASEVLICQLVIRSIEQVLAVLCLGCRLGCRLTGIPTRSTP
jgi:hypothetical protein